MATPNPTHARISIIGAGPGGLTCARILQRHGVAVTVYDRDAGPDARNQGGTLDLHADNGQIALREAGLLEEFFTLSRPEGQEMRRMDPTGTVTSHQIPEPDELFKPEIDRGQLRDLLLDSLQPGTVRWGQALQRVSGPAQGWPIDTIVIVITNDLTWWVPFAWYLLDGWPHFRATWRASSRH
jgi:2-polyprenyl-6-methoxyphenol hydroxylase-like FAD-dependent oxidoreductase